MERVLEGSLTIKEAASFLGLSERQVKRLKKGMKEKGVAALAHGNRGRTPKNAIPKDIKNKVAMLGASVYLGANATHMSELLKERNGITISPKSITRILVERKLISPGKKTRRGRKTRDRMSKEGLLVQMDASPHDWLENRGPRLHLHGAIDDATSKPLGLYFDEQETLHGYLEVTYRVVTNHGVPNSAYLDGHSIFFSPNSDKLTIEQELRGESVALTQFGRAMDQLNIRTIRARSPQAKGRIERLWQTLQDRLIIELRLAGICDVDAANAFLPGFIKRFITRFAVEARDPEPAYKPAPATDKLRTILCVKEQRTVSNGSVISYRGQTCRLIDQKNKPMLLPPKAKVEVLTHLDGSRDILYQGRTYTMEPYTVKKPVPSEVAPGPHKPVGRKPSPDNPWLNFTLEKPRLDPVEAYFKKHSKRHLSTIS